jgi:hypothetical protein
LVGDGELVATNGRLVLGNSSNQGPYVWDSQTGSVTYLASYAPAGTYFGINGSAIDAEGDVVGTANTVPPGGQNPTLGHALEWIAIPEPTTMAWLGTVTAALLFRTKRRRKGHG